MAKNRQASGGTPATAVLAKEGVEFAVHTYDHDPSAASYGKEAADAMGVDPERVFKTLVADVDGTLTVAVVPVAGTLDLKALAGAVGGKKAAMADPAAVTRTTGYVLGGVSPLGQRKQLPTVLDETALLFDTMFCSAGKRGMEIELAPAELVRLTGAITAPIGRAD
ncbi:MAG: Cys-tRNA(Pro) deacylase [Catenulispora sp.]|nr:Cys-tRNA(Pro) deacylase [Catenulispora sp.]